MAYIRKRGDFQWQAEIRRKGQKAQSRTFNTRAEAERWARHIENEMDRGIFVDRKEAESTTLTEALERYEREVSVYKKGYKQEKKRIAMWLDNDLAKRYLANLRGTDFAEYRDARLKAGASPGTIRLDLALISHLFTVATKEWGLESLANPVKAIRMPQPSKARDRRFIGSEEARVTKELGKICKNPYIIPAVQFAAETAMRQSELSGMRWEWVDLKNRVVELPETKNGDARRVPLSSKAAGILKTLPRSFDGKVFLVTPDYLSRVFVRACRQAGIEGMRFHDLRHEATSRLFEKGLNPMEAAAVTGHKTLSMLKRYTHLRAEDLAKKMG